MTERHEIIEFSPQIPIKFFMHQLGVVGRHWHSSPELLLVLDGEVRLTVDEDSFLLKSEDIFLINSNSIHEIHSQSAVLIAIQFKPEMFSQIDIDLEELVFDCNSTTAQDSKAFTGLRYGIAKILRENTHRNGGTDAGNISLSYLLLSELLANFRIPETNAVKVHKKYMRRLAKIIDYIDEHYRENFTLNDLAENQQLSVPCCGQAFL